MPPVNIDHHGLNIAQEVCIRGNSEVTAQDHREHKQNLNSDFPGSQPAALIISPEKSNCDRIDVGNSTQQTIDRQDFHINSIYTAWVESFLQGHRYSSRNITLTPRYSIKYDPLPSEEVRFSRFNGTLRLKWKRPELENQPLLKEARYKRRMHFNWTTGDCNLQKDADDSERCTLSLAENTAYEIQLRHKSHDSRSHWSEWSDTIFVPVELQESPELCYSVGEFSKDGQRNLSFHWEKAAADQGQVKYILKVRMLSCLCEGSQRELEVHMNRTNKRSGSVLISGAVYNLSIKATNIVGQAPVRSYMIAPRLHTGDGLVKISPSNGNRVSVGWTFKKQSKFYCIQWQPLTESPASSKCVKGKFLEGQNLTFTGAVEPAKCYRIAAYSRQKESWSSLGSVYYLKPSKDRGSSNISVLNITAHSATVRWDGSLHNDCPSLLWTCYVVKYVTENATSKGQMANTSMTYYTLKDLLPGTKYNIEVIGRTKYGEMLSIGHRHFMTQETDDISSDWISLVIILVVIILVIVLIAICCRKRMKRRLWPVMPNPYDSNATKFTTIEPNLVATSKALMTSTVSSEETEPAEALMVFFNPEKEAPVVDMEDDLSSHYNISVEKAKAEVMMDGHITTKTEAEIEIDADLPFEYKKQMLLTSTMGEQEDEKDLGEMFNDSHQDESDKKDTELFINTDFNMVPSSLFTLQLKVNFLSPNE
ncbi:interleukin-12 receptor subunit beta-1 [Microcaecilia unicolor]|uniref:Interleukin-12 receptor subunit beta-1 n=1 Tax=Microcaecilia unicolor TaxID=1415580 RepID=A0A6P7ZI53_9AMPH|nr:interleukin-12 receptor subunit beta-1 [Microcaecilia unicolor]